MARSTALARAARQSDRTHDRLARRAIGHLREGALRAAVVNVYIETFTLGPLTSTGFILFNRQ
jgi:hypothetical protein